MKELSFSRREFIRSSALWTGMAGLGMARACKVSAAVGSLPTAPADKETDLIAQVLAFVREEQIEFFGIGAMAAAYQTLQTALKQEIPQGSRLPRVISLAFTRPPAVAEVTPDSGVQRQPHEVSIPRPRLSSTTSRLCELFRSRGYRAKTHAPGLPGLPKMAGRLAGLGWIGRNSLLIIPGPGPRVALAAVLTDAPLPVTCKEPVENHCGNCRRCVDACPANAYTGEPFRETDPLTVRFDPDKCRRWCEELRDQRRSPEICSDEGDCCGGVCNLCAKACPYGEGKCLLGG